MKVLFVAGVVRAPFVGPIDRLVQEGHDIAILLEEEAIADSLYPDLQQTCEVVELFAGKQNKFQRVRTLLGQTAIRAVTTPRSLWKLGKNLQFDGLKSIVVRASLLAGYLKALDKLGTSYDIIHTRDGGLSVRIAQLQAAGLIKGEHVASFHGIDLMGYSAQECRERYRLLFETAAALTVQTEFMRELILEAGAPADRVHVVPSAVEVNALSWTGPNKYKNGDILRLVSVGRLIPLKAHSDLIHAVALLRENNVSATLDVYGDGPQKDALQREIISLNLQDAVLLHGAKPYLEVIAHVRTAHIFVHTPKTINDRKTEAMGLVTLEAQLIGLPCVVSRSGGVPETVLEKVSAELVPEASPRAIADAIISLIDRQEYWETNARKGRNFVIANFSVERVVADYKKIYMRALARQFSI